MTTKQEIEQLKERIARLEQTILVMTQLNPPTMPPLHYHNGQPCYNNPCTYC